MRVTTINININGNINISKTLKASYNNQNL